MEALRKTTRPDRASSYVDGVLGNHPAPALSGAAEDGWSGLDIVTSDWSYSAKSR